MSEDRNLKYETGSVNKLKASIAVHDWVLWISTVSMIQPLKVYEKRY